MCSIGEDDFGDEGGLHAMVAEAAPSLTIDPATVCKKCNLKSAIVKLDFKEAQCEECFLAYLRHKFRANLGSTKIVARGAKVMVVYDGKAASTVLLDMIRYARTQDKFKRLHIEPFILYIDNNCLFHMDLESRIKNFKEIKDLLKQFSIKSFYASFGKIQVFDIEEIQMNADLLSSEETFLNSVTSIKNLTSQQDYVHCTTSNVIRQCAEQINCEYAFTTEIGSDLAVKLLTNIALGRGSSVSQDVSFCDTRTEVKIIRPIRDFNGIEIETYIKLTKVKCVSKGEIFGGEIDMFASIQNLTKGFVEELQENFLSTVSTVFRTGSKIAASTGHNLKNNDSIEKCAFCKSKLDYYESSTLRAIEFSRVVSLNAGLDNGTGLDERVCNAVEGLDLNDKSSKLLCHGCRNVFRDLENPDTALNII